MMQPKATTIDQYIEGFGGEVRARLETLRATIRETVPEATETIRYGMPTYKLNGNLVHFAGYEHHIGFYPTPSGITHFAPKLKHYPQSKGAVQFPHTMPLPLDLIRKIVAFRVAEQRPKK